MKIKELIKKYFSKPKDKTDCDIDCVEANTKELDEDLKMCLIKSSYERKWLENQRKRKEKVRRPSMIMFNTHNHYKKKYLKTR